MRKTITDHLENREGEMTVGLTILTQDSTIFFSNYEKGKPGKETTDDGINHPECELWFEPF